MPLPLSSGKKKNSYKACCSLDAPRGSSPLSFPMQAISLPPSDISLDELCRLLRPVTVDRSSSDAVFQNWGRTFRCRPSSVFRPETEHQLELILELALREKQAVRAVGIGHSPSDLACTSGFMIQMNRLDKIIEVRRYRRISLSYWSIFITPILIPIGSWIPGMAFLCSLFPPLRRHWIYLQARYTNLTSFLFSQ
jgi:hypothetical protein